MPNAENNSQMPKSAKKGIQPAPLRPPPPTKDLSPEQKDAMSKIGNLFKGRTPQYQPILKSLEAIDIEQRLMTITIDGDVTVECLVIPLQELIFKEWRQLSGSTLQPQKGEETE